MQGKQLIISTAVGLLIGFGAGWTLRPTTPAAPPPASGDEIVVPQPDEAGRLHLEAASGRALLVIGAWENGEQGDSKGELIARDRLELDLGKVEELQVFEVVPQWTFDGTVQEPCDLPRKHEDACPVPPRPFPPPPPPGLMAWITTARAAPR